MAENHEGMAFLRVLAGALGAEVVQAESEWGYGRLRARAEGREFWLTLAKRGRGEGTVTISGGWPHWRSSAGHSVVCTPRDAGAIKHNDSYPEASAASSRGVERIAADFKRRFFPEFRPCHDAAAARARELEAEAAASLALARALAHEFGGSAKSAGGSYGNATAATAYIDGVGVVTVDCDRREGACHDRISFESRLYALTPARARRILAILTEERERADADA